MCWAFGFRTHVFNGWTNFGPVMKFLKKTFEIFLKIKHKSYLSSFNHRLVYNDIAFREIINKNINFPSILNIFNLNKFENFENFLN
jgi:hypothetical protein